MSRGMRVIFLGLMMLTLLVGNLFINRNSATVAAQGKAKQLNGYVVFMPTGNSMATGFGVFTLSDSNTAAGPFLVSRIEVSGMPTGKFVSHIHEGFCPPPVGPEPDQQGPVKIDLEDTVGFSLDNVTRSLVTVTMRTKAQLPTRANGFTDFEPLKDPNRNFYVNIHQRSSTAPDGAGPGLTCGRLVFQ